VADSPSLAKVFTLGGVTLRVRDHRLRICGFGAAGVAAAGPARLSERIHQGRRDFSLAAGILLVRPQVLDAAAHAFRGWKRPGLRRKDLSFLFITIACGAISGFHSLISSGTTPKMILREGHARFIGYGAMLLESFVGVMAMVAACAMTPGVYFAINSPASIVGATPGRPRRLRFPVGAIRFLAQR